MKPAFEIDQQVRVTRIVRDDGTFAGKTRGDLLVRRGSLGYVREWGVFLQDTIVYQVHFLDVDLIVGCREQELIAGDAPWLAGAFQYGDRVSSRHSLVIRGEVVVSPGGTGRVLGGVSLDSVFHYQVLFGQRIFQVPEKALILEEEQA
ncbi:nitrogen fixation protein NifZ [Pectobacterium cacticida]|uniref:Nitrogen fixation protein NifZ n=1 Tax=Pectobacterium cacticida TaxID=69221 RepID=A0ABZ2G4E1_9GAMM|nr:nitrogen fixation protein NifZ [Pectobacterium cacticida]UYX05434.1 nitrogen fixation protein NifZ [Pectobacterium cacticida]